MDHNIVWLRRDLRVYDHAALDAAMKSGRPFLPVFIFDKDILARFTNKKDRRLSFILNALCDIHAHCKQYGSGVLVCYGNAQDIWQNIATSVQPNTVFADEDYEPETRERDATVAAILAPLSHLQLLKDHVIFAPNEIYSQTGTPFKVYTPYSKAWWAKFAPENMGVYATNQWELLAPITAAQQLLKNQGVEVLDLDDAPEKILSAMGYEYQDDRMWQPASAQKRLEYFVKNLVTNYTNTRDIVGMDGTSQLSPYLRFGIISVRDCFRQAHGLAGAEKWLNELIWREFYAMTLYHAPESAHTEWNIKYRDKIAWRDSESMFQAWCEGKTGFPIIDAAMRQLVQTGWMHNRARMIVASFLTKDIHIDWRKGEAFFAEYLMDYELASNVGGWQWAASTGTDAQPYFRIFNPYLQSKKFDPEGGYIRRFVPELSELDNRDIHEPHLRKHSCVYPPPVVDHYHARDEALKMFKEL